MLGLSPSPLDTEVCAPPAWKGLQWLRAPPEAGFSLCWWDSGFSVGRNSKRSSLRVLCFRIGVSGMSYSMEWLHGPEGFGEREEVLCDGGSPFGNMLGPRTGWMQLRLETVCAPMSPGERFHGWKGTCYPTSPEFYLVSSTRSTFPRSPEADGSGCRWGHALGFLLEKELAFPCWSSLKTPVAGGPGRAGPV